MLHYWEYNQIQVRNELCPCSNQNVPRIRVLRQKIGQKVNNAAHVKQHLRQILLYLQILPPSDNWQ